MKGRYFGSPQKPRPETPRPQAWAPHAWEISGWATSSSRKQTAWLASSFGFRVFVPCTAPFPPPPLSHSSTAIGKNFNLQAQMLLISMFWGQGFLGPRV